MSAYYLSVIVVFVSRPFMFDQRAEILGHLAVALPPSYWLLNDAKHRVFVPHIIQPAIVGLWFIVIPAYLIGTRKWRGVLYLVLHVVFSILVIITTYNLSVAFVWPIVFDSGG